MNPLALALALVSADSVPQLPSLPPPHVAGTIALGWGGGGVVVEGDQGRGWGSDLRTFVQWHPWEATALRLALHSQDVVGASFRMHRLGAGLDGILQWHRGPFRPRLAGGAAFSRLTSHARPFDHIWIPREEWAFHVPVELGAEWLLGSQVSLHVWSETQVFALPSDLLDGREVGARGFAGGDRTASAGLAASYRLDPVRDSDRDGVEDRRDRCVTAPEDRDGFQDDDGCPDPDNDKDNVSDLRDRCPDQAEDRDGFQDDDGCPELDNDADGVVDTKDRCPVQPEDRDGFHDDDGCPDLDNDADGVVDTKDRCPLQAEDRDGFQDDDGCPELDNDADAIADSVDECPREGEDRDGFQDGDGCPDLDNDRDGVLDALDRCPVVPETINGSQDDDGCPDIALKPDQSMIADRVWFREGTDEFLPEAQAAIQELAAWMAGEPAARIEIRGHTDDQGADRVNQILSQKRAEALRVALIGRGVASERVRSRGFGRMQPIASNRTSDGRARNRRIEIFRYQ